MSVNWHLLAGLTVAPRSLHTNDVGHGDKPLDGETQCNRVCTVHTITVAAVLCGADVGV